MQKAKASRVSRQGVRLVGAQGTRRAGGIRTKPIHLSVLKINPSRALYERLGFRPAGETETHILMKKDAKFWFPAKTYGWGWGPPTRWQGWVALSAYIVLAIGGAFSLPPDEHTLAFLGYMITISAGLVFLCWFQGEKPGWRWGKKGPDLRQN